MSRLATILVAVLLAAGCTSTDDLDATPTRTPVPRWQTLDNVIDRDELRCGVDHELAPFGYAEADGTVSGFEIEFCAAIAAAVLRDASKVVYVLRRPPVLRGSAELPRIARGTSTCCETARSMC